MNLIFSSFLVGNNMILSILCTKLNKQKNKQMSAKNDKMC